MQPRRAGNIWSNEDAHLAQLGSKPAAKIGGGAIVQPSNLAPGKVSKARDQRVDGNKVATAARGSIAKPGKHAVPSSATTAGAQEEDASIGGHSSSVTARPSACLRLFLLLQLIHLLGKMEAVCMECQRCVQWLA